MECPCPQSKFTETGHYRPAEPEASAFEIAFNLHSSAPHCPMRVLSIFVLGLAWCAPQHREDHASEIPRQILETKAAIEKTPLCAKGCVFLTAWDFDGTILKGDSTEGLVENGNPVYSGLEETAINAGHSSVYRPGEFKRFWADYEEMDRVQGHTAAYTYLPKIFKGAKLADLEKIAAVHFARVLAPFYFTSSVRMFLDLKTAGITPYVISAAPHIFIRSSAETLQIPADHIYGIEVAIDAGRVTDRVVEPVTYAAGKAKRLEIIVQELAKKGKPVFVLGAFGNSYHTDADFLQWTLRQKLPAGKAVALMINGGPAPAEYRGAFTEVKQEFLMGHNPSH
jgi:phosphoserine phosphatase